MKKLTITLLGLSLAAIFSFGCSSNASQQAADTSSGSGSAKAVSIEAKNWEWTINQPSIKAGDKVEITAKATEGAHELSIEGTDVKVMLTPGKEETVSFTPDKAGDYKVFCSLPCGEGHANMSSSIKVE